MYRILHPQLLKGAGEGMKDEFGLAGLSPGDFYYLNQSSCTELPDTSDEEEYVQTRECMESIGLSESEQFSVFQVLAVVLHIGNLQFDADESGEGCAPAVSTSAAFDAIVKLLDVDAATLIKGLCTRTLSIGNISQTQTADQALDLRDTLAKTLYTCLFQWLVNRINATIKSEKKANSYIGILDIFGFEVFQVNSFEQLCINYTNEKLQRHFNRHIFEIEQAEYAREGIDWTHVAFNDNQECLDLIEGKPAGKPGVITQLNDMWREKGEIANTKFLAALNKSFAAADGPRSKKKGAGESKGNDEADGHPYYVKSPNFNHEAFGIKHYAGLVAYTVDGFNGKNLEAFSDDLRNVIHESRFEFIGDIFAANETVVLANAAKAEKGATPKGKGSPRKRRGSASSLKSVSVGSQFKGQLNSLMETLEATAPWYIRCVKPNPRKNPADLASSMCLLQLRYAGMMETIRIREQGFALREEHDLFFRRYRLLFPAAKDLTGLIDGLSRRLGVDSKEWQIGKTKVFVKKGLADKLEGLARVLVRIQARRLQRAWARYCLKLRAITVQAAVRGCLERRRYQRSRFKVIAIQSLARGNMARRNLERLIREVKQGAAAVGLQKVIRGRQGRALAERVRSGEEARKLQEEEEARIKAEEEERLRKEEEERRRKEEDERQVEEAARIKAEEEERARNEEEERKRKEEEEAARLQREEEERIRLEEDTKRREEEEAAIKAERDSSRTRIKELELEVTRLTEENLRSQVSPNNDVYCTLPTNDTERNEMWCACY